MAVDVTVTPVPLQVAACCMASTLHTAVVLQSKLPKCLPHFADMPICIMPACALRRHSLLLCPILTCPLPCHFPNISVHQANPVSPGSPFSAKQRKWSGIVQQVQDSSARLDLRRRQSTEAAAAGTSLLLHMEPSSTSQRNGAAASGLQPMRRQFAAPKGALVRRAAKEAAQGSVQLQAGARSCSDSSSNCPLQTPAARDKVGLRNTL